MTLHKISLLFVLLLSSLLFAQTKEQKAIMELPNVLISENGNEVNSVEQWEDERRPELITLFEKYVYGKFPTNSVSVEFNPKKEVDDFLSGKAILKEVSVIFSVGKKQSEMGLLIILPKKKNYPIPLFVGLNFYGNHTIHPSTEISLTKSFVKNRPEFCIMDNKATHLSRGVRSNRWPVERIIERGYGLAAIYYGDLDPDFHDDFENGIHGIIYSEENRIKSDEGAAIAAWAYGLTKSMDYFEMDDMIDENRIAVIGHSRLGKTALWAGAIDDRFAITISNNSGCGGAALSRRKMGETLKDINSVFPHWFCKNFHDFNDRENELPIDQHMLISLIAPRAVYVGSAKNDEWADPYGEYLSLFHSGPVFELYGQSTLTSKDLPELNSPAVSGKMGYHIRSGSHDLARYDWEKYMDFADQIFFMEK
jgi:hypothetical protein